MAICERSGGRGAYRVHDEGIRALQLQPLKLRLHRDSRFVGGEDVANEPVDLGEARVARRQRELDGLFFVLESGPVIRP
jgi:hypothetical protein